MPSVLVLGDATCVHDDAKRALELFTPDLIAACNNIGVGWAPVLDHWFTLHPSPCQDWVGIQEALRRRTLAGLNKPTIWSYKAASPVIDMITDDWGGATGLLAVKGMLEIGCRRIVLAGVPMVSEEGHWYDDKHWQQAHCYTRAWEIHLKEIAPWVRSCSGYTRTLLGEPDTNWLAVPA